ncbi:hypothetical protein LZP81_14515 [Streptomyces parvulus]|uniref:hypothetical protein n=1 Tax=Streptomyces parvulus TaxID=146923 RepID=UPI001E5E8486|nr:hypothetical protein [Streptomyces parvulus]MCC9155649.1 hypothetical protein [Streptomyces parvulus]MCE7688071.1 hypothetical protein [Streptomyces parvulus]
MSLIAVSRQNLCDRLASITDAADQELLVDGPLTDVAHNNRARLLRNGLMVVAFTSLEDFIRARTGEALDCVSRSVIKFQDFPEPLRMAATFGAMRAVQDRARMAQRSGGDPFTLLQDAAQEIASTKGGALQISRYSLGYSGSNVSSQEIADILGCLNVKNAWGQITEISSRAGFGSIPLKAEYESAAQLRHAAAHSPVANTQPADLKGFCEKALAIALGFDVLTSRASRLIRDGDGHILKEKVELAKSIVLRFLDEAKGGYSEKIENSARAYKKHADRDTAWKASMQRATKENQPVVERNKSELPVVWATPDLL